MPRRLVSLTFLKLEELRFQKTFKLMTVVIVVHLSTLCYHAFVNLQAISAMAWGTESCPKVCFCKLISQLLMIETDYKHVNAFIATLWDM